MSFLREFRNAYASEGGVVDPIKEAKYKEMEAGSVEIEHLRGVRDSIKNIELDSGDDEEKSELEKRKEIADLFLTNVLKSIKQYKERIIEVEEKAKGLKNDMGEIRDYQKEMEKLDLSRKRAHDILLESVNKAIKFISFNFGDINKKALGTWEDEQEEQGKMILDVKRIKFPKNVICTDNVNLSDRKSVADWAFKLTDI